jgi:hypothetical protein
MDGGLIRLSQSHAKGQDAPRSYEPISEDKNPRRVFGQRQSAQIEMAGL